MKHLGRRVVRGLLLIGGVLLLVGEFWWGACHLVP